MANRSKYIPRVTPLLAEKYARRGDIDEEIAQALCVSRATLSRWKNEHPEFKEALERGKEPVDYQVERTLLKRALGYDYEEETAEYEFGADGEKVLKSKKIVKKQLPPDITAIIFWLVNRTDDWVSVNKERRNRSRDEIDETLIKKLSTLSVDELRKIAK